MSDEDIKKWRIVPSVYEELSVREGIGRRMSVDWRWTILDEALGKYAPSGLGILLPFAWQMHWYAYSEAQRRGIITATATPNNVMALTGMMRTAPIEAVIATKESAQAFVDDLKEQGMLSRIRLWVIVSVRGETASFRAPLGETVYDSLP